MWIVLPVALLSCSSPVTPCNPRQVCCGEPTVYVAHRWRWKHAKLINHDTRFEWSRLECRAAKASYKPLYPIKIQWKAVKIPNHLLLEWTPSAQGSRR